jgi:hypothetical protein
MKIYKVCILALCLVGVLISGQSKMSGGGYYTTNMSTTNGQTFTQKYAFNTTNRFNSSIDYNGYSLLIISGTAIATPTDSTEIDSLSGVAYMLDYLGHRVASNDSVILFDNITLTEGDTLDYRLDNLSMYSTHYGIAIRYTRVTATATDSVDLYHGVLYN